MMDTLDETHCREPDSFRHQNVTVITIARDECHRVRVKTNDKGFHFCAEDFANCTSASTVKSTCLGSMFLVINVLQA
jgi:hypothetical protein